MLEISQLVLCASFVAYAASVERSTRVLLAGGHVGSPSLSNRVDTYDPKGNGSWMRAADMIEFASVGPAAAVLDGRAYVMGGGGDGTKMIVYDPETDSWSSAPPMIYARYYHGAATLGNKLYAIGGLLMSSGEVFDPQTQSWMLIESMSVPRAGLGVVALGDRLYAIGGAHNITYDSVELYDPKANNWSLVAPMNVAREQLCAASLGGKLYAIGGVSSHDGETLGSVEAYDPTTDKWSFVRSMQMPKKLCGAAVFGGHIWVFGGAYGDQPFDIVEVYDPVQDIWGYLFERMPTTRMGHAVALLANASFAEPTTVVPTTPKHGTQISAPLALMLTFIMLVFFAGPRYE